jgi:hypothetical protein
VPYGAAGNTYLLEAEAMDTAGMCGRSRPVRLIAVRDTQAPTVAITAPRDGSQVVEGTRGPCAPRPMTMWA